MTYSFIIPVYQAAAYLRRCYESVKQQKIQTDLFFIDDGSWDASAEMVDETALCDGSAVVIHQQNAGPSAARNRGIDLSSSEYLLFVDSDDYISDDYVETVDNALTSDKTEILVFGMASSISKTVPAEKETVFGHDAVLAHYAKTWNAIDYYSSCNKAFSRALLTENDVRFMENSTVEEDFVFNLRALDCANSLAQITDVLYYYDQKEVGSLTTSYNPKRFEGKRVSFAEECRLLMAWNMPTLVQYQKQQLVNFVSVAVNNLLYKECGLSHGEKIREIKRYFNDAQVRECAETIAPSSLRVKMMVVLIKYRLYRTCYGIHFLVRISKIF